MLVVLCKDKVENLEEQDCHPIFVRSLKTSHFDLNFRQKIVCFCTITLQSSLPFSKELQGLRGKQLFLFEILPVNASGSPLKRDTNSSSGMAVLQQ